MGTFPLPLTPLRVVRITNTMSRADTIYTAPWPNMPWKREMPEKWGLKCPWWGGGGLIEFNEQVSRRGKALPHPA